jgi:hypothetical protein
MQTALAVLLLVGSALLVWSSARGAAEIARAHADALCRQHGLQLLDQTVALRAIAVVRAPWGLAFKRTYGFEVSADAVNRLRGTLVFVGEQLEGASLPMPESVNG